MFSAADIERACAAIATETDVTPIVRVRSAGDWPSLPGARLFAKLELLQRTGTFKARAAVLAARQLGAAERERGLVAVSAGNHAIAVAFAARVAGTTATVVMIRSANPYRVAQCEALGARIEFRDTIHAAFERAHELERSDGLTLLHPFESERVVLGTATLGAEIVRQCPEADAIVVPVGGGGLAGGVALGCKTFAPGCKVYGVEPRGAASLSASLDAGEPVGIERVDTIADSLGAPRALPLTFGVCQRYLDDVVLVSDDEIRAAMRDIAAHLRLAVEPACAASTAGALGPLQERLAGRNVVLLLCGSNIDPESWRELCP